MFCTESHFFTLNYGAAGLEVCKGGFISRFSRIAVDILVSDFSFLQTWFCFIIIINFLLFLCQFFLFNVSDYDRITSEIAALPEIGFFIFLFVIIIIFFLHELCWLSLFINNFASHFYSKF
jgi:hypothetical protein